MISEMRERPQGVGRWKKGRSLEAVSRQYMHTQKKADEVKFVITLTMATTEAENNNKDTSGGVTKRIRRHISYPKVRKVGTVPGGKWHGTQNALL